MSENSHLQKAVVAELNWEPSLRATHVVVSAQGGIVTLTGYVESLAEKHAAEAAACRVKGVKAVVEEVEVRLPSDTWRTDEELAATAVDRLSADVSIPPDAVKIKVERGWLTLTGAVEWQFQRDAAEHALRRLPGAVGISNRIEIEPHVDVANVSDEIMHALNRSWFFDPQTIAVSADGGRVTLTGTVPSPHDRQIAASTAWAAPGVTDVVNDIQIA
jgi:osmotically-inducible protein OsmY